MKKNVWSQLVYLESGRFGVQDVVFAHYYHQRVRLSPQLLALPVHSLQQEHPRGGRVPFQLTPNLVTSQ